MPHTAFAGRVNRWSLLLVLGVVGLTACNEEVTTPAPKLRRDVVFAVGDSTPQACQDFGCSSLDSSATLDLLDQATQSYLNALLSGNQECMDTFGKAFQKVAAGHVFWAQQIEFGGESYEGFAVWRRPPGSTDQWVEHELYIKKTWSQEPTMRMSILAHEAAHHLQGYNAPHSDAYATQARCEPLIGFVQ